jgi:hypothetical protein
MDGSALGERWVFGGPRPGGDDTLFRDWCVENPELFAVVSERRPRPPHVELHRTGCALLLREEAMPAGGYLRTCGDRETLDDYFSDSEIVCLLGVFSLTGPGSAP